MSLTSSAVMQPGPALRPEYRNFRRGKDMNPLPVGTAGPARHPGPRPGILAIIFTVLFLAGLAPVTMLFGDRHFPSPLQPPDEIVSYFREHPGRVAACAFLQFASAIPLGLYAATMTSRLRFLGVRAAGVDIALFGGFAASFMTLVSALLQWALSRPGIAADATLVQALYFMIFATGGPGYGV